MQKNSNVKLFTTVRSRITIFHIFIIIIISSYQWTLCPPRRSMSFVCLTDTEISWLVRLFNKKKPNHKSHKRTFSFGRCVCVIVIVVYICIYASILFLTFFWYFHIFMLWKNVQLQNLKTIPKQGGGIYFKYFPYIHSHCACNKNDFQRCGGVVIILNEIQLYVVQLKDFISSRKHIRTCGCVLFH